MALPRLLDDDLVVAVAGLEGDQPMAGLLDPLRDVGLGALIRGVDGDAIADLAINNFTEMRERTADPKFLLQKKIEARLHEKYPDKWIPAYSQVTFSPHIRYSEALQRGQKQEAIMQEVMEMPGIADKWDSAEVEKLILGRVAG